MFAVIYNSIFDILVEFNLTLQIKLENIQIFLVRYIIHKLFKNKIVLPIFQKRFH